VAGISEDGGGVVVKSFLKVLLSYLHNFGINKSAKMSNMEIKIDGNATDMIWNVIFSPINRPGSINRYYEGQLVGDINYIMELVSTGSFTLEVDGVEYKHCRVSDSKGRFKYLPERMR